MASNDRRVGSLLVQMRADIGGLRTDIREMETQFKSGFQGIQTSAATAFKSVGASIVGAFSVTAVISFGKNIVNLAGQLQDLQQQTGISGQLLSGLKSTIEENGSSLEAFAKGIFTAQKNLGQIDSATDAAAVAIKALGLNLNQLRNATPEKFLELIAEALSKIDNPVQRAAAGAAILGKQFQQLGPILSEISGRFEELRAQGMSQADIKLLDDVGDAWTRLTNRVQIAGATMLAAAFRTIDALRELKLSLNLGGAAGTGALIGGIADRPGRAGLTQSLEDSLQKGAITPFEAASGKAGKKDTAAEDFIASLKKQADALRVSIKEVTAGAAAAKDYGIELEFAAFKSKLLADNKPIPPDLARQFLAAKNALAELTKELAAAKRESDAVADIAKAFDQDLGEMAVASEQAAREVLKLKDAYDELQKATEKMRLTDLSAALDQDSEEFGRMGEEAARFSEKFRGENFEKDWQAIESVIRSATSAISTAFNGVIQGTQSVGEAFRNMGQSILLSMAAAINEILIVKPLIEGLKQSLQGSSSESSGTGGIFSSILGAIGSALSGALSGSYRASPIFAPIATATGGIFSRPTLRLIGEAGPEAVVPLSKMRGMGGEKQQKPTVIINGNIIPNPGVSREQVVQIVMKDFDNRGPLTHALENRRMR